jgi:hypothetical protein
VVVGGEGDGEGGDDEGEELREAQVKSQSKLTDLERRQVNLELSGESFG